MKNNNANNVLVLLLIVLSHLYYACQPDIRIPSLEMKNTPLLDLETWELYPIGSLAQFSEWFQSPDLMSLPIPDSSTASVIHRQKVDFLDLQQTMVEEVDTVDGKTYYLISTSFHSDKERKDVLMIGTTANLKAWRNGNALLPLVSKPTFDKYSSYYQLPVNKGENKIVLALEFDTSVQHLLVAGIGTREQALNDHHQKHWSDFLGASIYQATDTLSFVLPFYDPEATYELSIIGEGVSIADTGVTKGTIAHVLSGLKNGLYRCSVSIAGFLYQQDFLVGSYEKYWTSLEKHLSNEPDSVFYQLNVLPLLSRAGFLLKHKPVQGQRASFFKIEAGLKGKWYPLYKGQSRITALGVNPYFLDGIRARFVRITGYGNSTHDWNTIAEVGVYGKKGEKGVAKELVVPTISASSHENEKDASYAYDDDLSTSWEAKGEGQWLGLDLGNEFYLTAIDIAWKKSIGGDGEIKRWEKKLIYLFRELYEISERGAFQEILPGRHISGYFSPIDSSVQNYIIQVPVTSATSGKYPLILHMMPRVEVPAPLINSHLLADTRDLDRSQLEAGNLGVIDVWAFARSYGSYLNDDHIEEYKALLNSINKKYNIDQGSVFLFATCSGFIKSVQLAQELPEQFSGLAACPFFYEDDIALNINHKLEQISHVPMFFVHANQDELTPVQSLLKFISLAQEKSLEVDYKILERTSRKFYVRKHYGYLYEKFLSMKLNKYNESNNKGSFEVFDKSRK